MYSRKKRLLYFYFLASVYGGQHASAHVISRVFSVIFNRRTSLYASFIFLENPWNPYGWGRRVVKRHSCWRCPPRHWGRYTLHFSLGNKYFPHILTARINRLNRYLRACNCPCHRHISSLKDRKGASENAPNPDKIIIAPTLFSMRQGDFPLLFQSA